MHTAAARYLGRTDALFIERLCLGYGIGVRPEVRISFPFHYDLIALRQ